jgi:tyrosyl-tRNA synthetase
MSGSLAEDLQVRGLVHQMTDPALEGLLDTPGSLTAYIGFDPTADSLHLGNLLMLTNLRRLQEAGHRVIALAGGGTGMIGDPGGRSEERNLLSPEELQHNLEKIRGQLERFVSIDGERGLLVDNGAWLWQTNLLAFLRDVGKHFTVNQMVAKDSVQTRFTEREQGISYTEFSYMLLQAFDFQQLFDAHGCNLQAGASDQWGNITMGIELIRKTRGAHVFGLTSPLVTKADGTKMGKSVGGAVWLDAERTSPYDLWQFLFNAEDAKVVEYVRMFTWRSHEELAALEEQTLTAPHLRAGQRALADDVVALVHGEAEAGKAARAAAVLFTPEVAELDETSLAQAVASAPSATLPPDGLPLPDALVALGLAESGRDARRQVGQGAVRINGIPVDKGDTDRLVTGADALHGRYVLVRKGKRDQGVLRVSR